MTGTSTLHSSNDSNSFHASDIDILIIEDDAHIARLIQIHLQQAGYSTLICGNGSEAAGILKNQPFKLLILDRMIPGMRGLELARWIRKHDRLTSLPIIMVTALDMHEEKVRGLDEGADDYLAKPFEPDELIARVRALLRRAIATQQRALSSEQLIQLDTETMRVTANGHDLDLRPLEFKLLQVLKNKPEKVRSREYLLDHVWGVNTYIEERTVDVTIKRLRKSLDTCSPQGVQLGDCIQTVRGAGYRYSMKQLH